MQRFSQPLCLAVFLLLAALPVLSSGCQQAGAAIFQTTTAQESGNDTFNESVGESTPAVDTSAGAAVLSTAKPKANTGHARPGQLHGDGDESSPGLVGNLITLVLLVMLQAVLGFDNLLYISLESRRAPVDKQKSVRVWGIGIAIVLRIALLFVLIKIIDMFQHELFAIPAWLNPFMEGHFSGHSLIVLAGGVFILYTATKEVMHMMRVEHHGGDGEKKPKSVLTVIFWIVLMNVVFSFDSILSAMALTHTFWVMAVAIVMGGILMIVLADTISVFLEKNRMYEVLGLFILFIVGVMLISEGGHLAHMQFFGNAVTPMTKTTFYFVIGVLVIVDIVQSRYQKKLLAQSSVQHVDHA